MRTPQIATVFILAIPAVFAMLVRSQSVAMAVTDYAARAYTVLESADCAESPDTPEAVAVLSVATIAWVVMAAWWSAFKGLR